MKKSLYFICCILLMTGLQSFQNPNTTVEDILQKAIELEQLHKILQKDSDGHFQPLMILTNGQLPEHIDLRFAGKPVKMISSEEAKKLSEEDSYMNVTEFRIKNSRARFQFVYNAISVRINLRNIDGEWTYRSMSMKGKGILYKNVDWTL
ncbi:MAG: hypothetical protein R2824_23695 [Saprospiraceae bacterium]|nr:hypothetical protein [Lewinella sp.]